MLNQILNSELYFLVVIVVVSMELWVFLGLILILFYGIYTAWDLSRLFIVQRVQENPMNKLFIRK